MYQITKGIPIPAAARTRSRYPFAEMEIGDSFAVFVHEEAPSKVADRVKRAGYAAGKKVGKKFRAAPQGDTTVRVWRVA